MSEQTTADYAARLKRALLMMEKAKARIDELERAKSEPIAIVGLACRFPGEADTPDRFWQNLVAGHDAIAEVPPERWSLDQYYDPDPDAPGKVGTRWGALLKTIDQFDPAFFGISPREAARMDPQQRLALEVAWEAFEHAGYAPDALAGSRTGVFLGICSNEYMRLQLADESKIDAYVSSGNALSIVANRISYVLDLRGPSTIVDSACSSSLVTMHLACQSLRSGDSDLALAGGVGLLVGPELAMSLTKARMMAPDGRCKTFDARANGYVRGEGCGIVALKRLSDALRDGDVIHALIRGTAVNQDGATTGITAPNGLAQQAVIRAALAAAGVAAHDIAYIEAHGTGTSLGDPIEVEALGATVGRPAPDGAPLLLGSVKTNIGHLEAASGVAGFIKTVLALKHGQIPPNLHFHELNPNISLEGTRIQIATRLQPWPTPAGKRRLAGISAFGFGGTNAHVILEEPPARAEKPAATAAAPALLVLSGRSRPALDEQARRLLHHLEHAPDLRLHDVAFTAALGRAHHPHRLATVALDLPDASRRLRAHLDGAPLAGTVADEVVAGSAPRLAFLFSGQGSQRPGMGKGLYDRFPVFRDALDRCDQAARPWLGRPLVELLFAPADTSLLHQTEFTQPALFALEVALATLLRSWGITPDLLLGHSVGEYVAAHLAGVFSLEDALKVVVHRGQLMARLCPPGAMLSVQASAEELEAEIRAGQVSLAALNGPRQTVLAGTVESIEQLAAELARRGLKTRRLTVSHAFHSALLEPMLAPFREVVGSVQLNEPRVTLISNLTGQLATEALTTADYWVQHVRQPVRFFEGAQAARAAGAQLWLELGAHPALMNLVLELEPQARAVATLRDGKDDATRLLSAVGALHSAGVRVDHAALWKGEDARRVPLPSYPFQRQRYWFQVRKGDPMADGPAPGEGHPLLGRRLKLPLVREVVFEARYRADLPDFLLDHVLQGVAVMPAAGFVATALSAVQEAFGASSCVMENFAFIQPMTLLEGEVRTVQVVLTPDASEHPTQAGFQIVSVVVGQEDRPEGWTVHCTGKVSLSASLTEERRPTIQEIQSACTERRAGPDLYAWFHGAGYALGPMFQWIGDVWRRDGEALCRLEPAEVKDADRYALYPGLIDSCFQLLSACRGADVQDRMYLPFSVEQFRFLAAARGPLWCHATLRPQAGSDEASLVGDLRLFTEDGATVARIDGLHLRAITADTLRAPRERESESWAWEAVYRPSARTAAPDERAGVWALYGDREGLAPRLAAALEARGQDVRTLDGALDPHDPQALRAALRALKAQGLEPRGVIHLAGLEGPAALPSLDPEQVLAAVRADAGTLLALVQAVLDDALQGLQLSVLTRGVATLPGEAEAPRPLAAPSVGLCRVLLAERPGTLRAVVDLPHAVSDELLESLVSELLTDDRETQIALREGSRHILRLQRTSARALPPPPLQPDRSYVVTGGLGALGLHLARWLVEHGARHLLLLGRSAPSPAARAVLDELTARGAAVTVAHLDVADKDALAHALAQLSHPLDGVFHTAGVLDDAVLEQQSWPRLLTSLRPKLLGALHLHALTQGQPLSYFVLFSSAAALLGSPGQANYAAANAALDTLATYRRSLGLPGASLQWGAWAGEGMAKGLEARLRSLGVTPLEPAQAMAAFGAALVQGANLLIARVDWEAYSRAAGTAMPLLSELVRPVSPQSIRPTGARSATPEIVAALSRAPRDKRRALLAEHLRKQIARTLGFGEDIHLEPQQPIQSLGMDSLTAVELRNDLATSLGRSLPATLLFDYPTLEALTLHLGSLLDEVALAEAPTALATATTATPAHALDTPIAVIGLSCRMPGGANDPESYWRLLAEGRDGISPVPADRWDVDAWYDPTPDTPGKTYTRDGGFLQGWPINGFDAAFFGVSPREAISMDPQQRLLLELSWEALEHAGFAPNRLFGSQTGVFVGISTNDYGKLELDDPTKLGMYSGSGNTDSVAAGRLSYVLGLHGPNFPIDTACSSSLVAVHLACQSLRSGECDVALAGGVNLMLSPLATLYFSQVRALAPDGHCKTFDASANGYVRSEGGGVVVLKRLSDALRDGDRVLAIIRGSAVNHDGRSNGLTAPNGPAQQAVIQRALAVAGVAPAQVSYVEAHGTGTPLGDPIELQALGAVLGQGRDPATPLLVGSAKSNIGHTEAAAGVAGLIKVILALQHGAIPPNLHFHTPNPYIPWDELPVRVPTAVTPWAPIAGRRIAGVSSFGFSGTNAHVILEEPPLVAAPPAEAALPILVPISARTPESLAEQARHWSAWLTGPGAERPLVGVAHTAALRRTHFDHRAAVVASSLPDLAAQLAALGKGEPLPGLVTATRSHASPRLIQVFSGQGSQWLGMGLGLLDREPVFRDALLACDQAIQAEAGWSVLAELRAGPEQSQLDRIDVVQPTLFAIAVALAALWQSWGVTPDGVIGHSMGEVAAAHVAGALDLEDAVRVICRRSRLMRRLSGQGAMALVEQTVPEVEALLRGYEGRLAVAVSNSPQATVISGEPAALDEVTAELTRREVFWRRIQVNVSSHSPQVDVLHAEMLSELVDLRPRAGTVPIWSTTRGRLIDGAEMDATYWWDNLRRLVLFGEMVRQASEGAATLFLEMSPHPVLVPSVEQCLAHFQRTGAALPSLRRDHEERRVLLESLGHLYAFGHDVAWERLLPTTHPVEPLPGYAWHRDVYWAAGPSAPMARGAGIELQGAHPLLGYHLSLSEPEGVHVWEREIGVERLPWLADHRVQGQILLPGAAYLEAALAAGREVYGSTPVLLDARFEQALLLPEKGAVRVQVTLQPAEDGTASWRLSSQPLEGGPWTRHSHGRMTQVEAAEVAPELEGAEARCTADVAPLDLYEMFQDAGIVYGPSFQTLSAIRRGDGEATGVLGQPPGVDLAPFVVHPALLDGAFQLGAAAMLRPEAGLTEDDTWLPVAVERVVVRRAPAAGARVAVLSRPSAASNELRADLVIHDALGPAVEVRGLSGRRLGTAGPAALTRWWYELDWQEQPPPATRDLAGAWLVLCDERGLGDALAEAIVARGGRPVRVQTGARSLAAVTALLEESIGPSETFRGAIDLRALDGLPPSEAGTEPLRWAVRQSAVGALELIQALALSARAGARLWLVTRGAQRVAGVGGSALGQALLWGLTRTAAIEHPELQPTVIDLGGDALEDLGLLVRELGAEGGEGQVALRGERRFVARLAPAGAWAGGLRTNAPPAIDAEGTWLVTGGLTGLGLSAAQWLVDRGARHLALVGRRPPSAEAEAVLRELRARGAEVLALAFDLAQDDQLEPLRAALGALPPITGAVHAAGALSDGVILRLDAEQFERVMGGKVYGGWNLHRLLADTPVRTLVLYASAAGLIGSPGQANYASANAFLDALAVFRRSHGQPALSVSWGPFSEVGLAARPERGGRLAQEGMASLSPAQGLSSLELLLDADTPAQVGVIRLSPRHLVRYAPHLATLPYLSRLMPSAQVAPRSNVLEAVLRQPPERRAEALTRYLREQVARVMRLPIERLDADVPLNRLGLDSLMGVELKNRLEADLRIRISTASLLTGATTSELARSLVERLEAPIEGDAPAEPREVLPRADRSGLLRASLGQERLWLLDQLVPERAAYNVHLTMRLAGPLSANLLERALGAVLDRHEALRTTFALVDGEVVQKIHAEGAVHFDRRDLSTLPGPHREEELARHERAEARRPFDLERGPLLQVGLTRLSDHEHALSLTIHHIISDAWSLGLLFQELLGAYQALKRGGDVSLPALPAQFADFAEWQRRKVAGSTLDAHRAYWKARLADTEVLRLPTDRPRPTTQSLRGDVVPLRIPEPVAKRLTALGREAGCTPFMTLMAAFQTLLHRYTGQTDIPVGTVTAGRQLPEVENVIGFFANTVVVRGDLSGNPSFRALLERVRDVCLAAYEHQDLPFDQVVEAVQPARDPSFNPLYQVCLLLENVPVPTLDLGELTIRSSMSTPDAAAPGTSKFDLTLCLVETGHGFDGSFEYSTDLFDRSTIERMTGHLLEVLASVAADPDQPLSRAPVLTASERRQILETFNGADAPLLPPLTLHARFAVQAAETPDRVALIDGDRRVTFRELDRRANQLAHLLRAQDLGPEPLIGVCMDSSAELIVAVLGVLKAGGAYVPLDPAYPAERLAYMTADAALPLILSTSARAAMVPRGPVVWSLDTLHDALAAQPDLPPDDVVGPEGAAYVIYTSGSTGHPKGVVGLHGAAMNRFQWMWRTYPFAADAVCCQKTALSFVDSIWEIWGPLLQGVPLVMVPGPLRKDLDGMVDLLARERITFLVLVPSLLRALLELAPPVERRLPHLDLWVCSGEALPTDLADAFRARFPRARLLNLYGSSEVSADVTYHPTWEQPSGTPVTLGKPIANTRIYLLDAQLEPVPIGVPGEIWVGGANLNRGYLGRPELTAERFRTDPFRPGERVYQTGDLGRWLPDGQIEYLGRKDHQVKVRGFRIELGEIEAMALTHPGVSQCLVVLREMATGPALVAYLVPAEGQRIVEAALREALRRRLPDHMIPAHLVTLDRLPTTPNGKVDRRRLPAPGASEGTTPRVAVSFRSDLERRIAAILKEVLHVDRVGASDNFFDLGGNSLLLGRVLARLRQELGRDDLTMVQLFQHPNARSLAEALGDQGRDEPLFAESRKRAHLRRDHAADDIAIIGMACRFPGARTPEQFWQNLVGGVESITRFSDEELRAVGVSEADLRDPRYVKARPRLDDVELFDAGFFGFNERDAALLDPQHRLFLECAWEAFEAAGYVPETFPGSVGVFAGAGLPTYLLGNEALRSLPMSEVFRTVLGSDKDYLATRVSHKLNLRGPSITVQTACSTSLVAVSLACDSLRSGQSDLVLAGAVSLQLPQVSGYRYEEGMIFSPDGHCRPFDARGGGTLFGSGAGVVLLKRLSEAIADNDIIHAVVRGVAVNNDGAAKVGYTAPSIEGQSRVIAEALAMARVEPDSLGYIEAHGTATTLGDPIEVAALTRVFHAQTRRRGFCGLGSVKSNLGHLDTAAGIAGLIKGVLMLKRGIIPPSLHFEQPNPHLNLNESPFFVPTTPVPWAANGAPRRLGVSAFGIGGTNAHVVLEEAPTRGAIT